MNTSGEFLTAGHARDSSMTSVSTAGSYNSSTARGGGYSSDGGNTQATDDGSSILDTTAIMMSMSNHHNMTLTAKPHAFAGAVLSPKHARELTPSLCLAISSALAEQSYRKTAVPYTLWITEAWRVLGWAEPSAALFWEMASKFIVFY